MRFDQEAIERSLADFAADRRSPVLLRLHRAFGIPCYTLTSSGAHRLLQACFPLRPLAVYFPLLDREMDNTGVDIAMNAAYPHIRSRVAFPPLALTLNSLALSTIQS